MAASGGPGQRGRPRWVVDVVGGCSSFQQERHHVARAGACRPTQGSRAVVLVTSGEARAGFEKDAGALDSMGPLPTFAIALAATASSLESLRLAIILSVQD